MRILVAFDSFKDSMTAEEACRVAVDVIEAEGPDFEVESAPLTDGGEGFCGILTEARGGELVERTVRGPRFEEISARFGLVALESLESVLCDWLEVPDSGTIAIIEMAQASGLERVPMEARDPWVTSSYGTGDLIREAHQRRVEAILLGIGGSATNDLGLGALEALGLGFLDSEKSAIEGLNPARWNKVHAFAGGVPEELPPIRIACDVENPLFGENGAAAIFGPQKGLKPEDWERIEEEGKRMARLHCRYQEADESLYEETGSGAAGGISFGLRAACGATLVPGIELVSRWLRLEMKMDWADLIITGEGRFDRSSLQGKGPGTLVRSAFAGKKRAWVFAGLVAEDLAEPNPGGLDGGDMVQIAPKEYSLERSIAEGKELLRAAVREKVRTVR